MATQGGTSGAPDRPNDAKAIDSILRSMGARADSRTVYMLLEFAYRYAVEILQDSHEFAVHAGRSEVKEADVKLAVDARATHSFTSPPTREFLAEIAEKRNALPLPTVGERYGPRLPPQNFLLTHPNFRIVPKVRDPFGCRCSLQCQSGRGTSAIELLSLDRTLAKIDLHVTRHGDLLLLNPHISVSLGDDHMENSHSDTEDGVPFRPLKENSRLVLV
ncbi:TFIID-31kDa-domain-containing protein [Gonapodya prolifera JEL478]|uniref:TFIID-31kDa-domain-containing protein n=1 Tax=Gonapodya prolifera (strain JEL478) TaxID=1344416 RepID=A0A138ZXT5_GONPJ|nr:TFIID-31kDa-domain-containing protein [Gonapodya prolifera JEL478]|eukprot:KXS09322.1 TFIID-31kDa-domain-containing protein [Gonapodya prolifera JEL478]